MITEQILQLDPSLSLIQEPSDTRFKAFNLGSTEVEVSEFLYGLIRLLKPQHILETGTYKGISSSYMATALKDNGSGVLDTIEYEPQHIKESKELWSKLGVSEYINSHQMLSFDFSPSVQYEFMFLDTEPDIRFKELVKFYPNLQPGGFVFLHDLPRGFCKGNINPDHPEIPDWPWGPVPEEMKQLLKEGKLVKWHFPNPREMAGFYKPKEGDYV